MGPLVLVGAPRAVGKIGFPSSLRQGFQNVKEKSGGGSWALVPRSQSCSPLSSVGLYSGVGTEVGDGEAGHQRWDVAPPPSQLVLKSQVVCSPVTWSGQPQRV